MVVRNLFKLFSNYNKKNYKIYKRNLQENNGHRNINRSQVNSNEGNYFYLSISGG